LLAFSAQPVLIAVMLLHAVYWGEKSWTLCGTAPVRLAAHLSYALYLYHPLAGKITKELNMPHLGLSAFALTLLLSIASYYLVERPFMRMRDHPKSLPAAQETATTAAVPGEI
jgi:peptidoglycan/LPS O-acetylase OafA/YrhL